MQTNDESGPLKSEGLRSWRWSTAVLAVTIFAAVLLNNARPIFYVSHYEMGDLAANSLQIIRAKHFAPVLGNYSRFGFYHPGPAFFYVYAASEALFHDALHVVPTPLNAQLIGLYALSAFFFSATLGVISRWLDSEAAKWFLSIALLLAAWHFSAVGEFYNLNFARPGLFSIWPPCVLVFPFLCFLIAAASVAAGGGRDLPLMTLAACFVVHSHVGMPLFVVPITLLVYGSFLLRLRHGRSGEGGWPWRAFPRAHWLACAIIVLFLVPIVIDLLTATRSNLSLIIDHLQNGYGERKGLLRSIFYFMHFAAYTPYPNSNTIPAFENFDIRGTVAFFITHWRAYGLWIVVILSPLLLLRAKFNFAAFRAKSQNANFTTPKLRSFLIRMYLVVGFAIVLTIVWGHIQEGPMYYFNAHFNFAVYYSLLLVFAVTLAQSIAHGKLARLAALSSGSPSRPSLMRAGPFLIALAAVALFARQARQFRYRPQDSEEQHIFATTMERALKSDSIQPKLLSFEGQAWAETVGVALYLQRAGANWYVADYAVPIPFIFGRDRAIPDKETALRLPHASVWRIVSADSSHNIMAREQELMVLPLTKDIYLVIRPSP
ncbi:MAG: hypothetical protein DME97_17515 [Verrucomicrobia bacterium]|nr:MAG: hypothetical protein DME97_17515 [Verrucomicrobiota bacterium]